MNTYDVVIIGGGLAGLTAALHLTGSNYTVLVFEKAAYPHHKVCGEYVSNEILPYLDHLGISLTEAKAVAIDTLQLTTLGGKSVECRLPLGGKGISRYALDDLLYKKCMEKGIPFVFESVTSVAYQQGSFVVSGMGQSCNAHFVVGAYGKRSNLDKQLGRNFIQKKSPWLGVKAHYKLADFPDNLVALHNFRGGYAGLSKTETGAVNFCYLVSYNSFQQEKDVAGFNANVIAENPFLASFLEKAAPIFKEPLCIGQLSFHQKKAVTNHLLMCGDTAGLIHPLCGNGMAMAIHSAKIASEGIARYFKEKGYTRDRLEDDYTKTWNALFGRRLWMGRQLQSLLLDDQLSAYTMELATRFPWLLKSIIKKTHGKPIEC